MFYLHEAVWILRHLGETQNVLCKIGEVLNHCSLLWPTYANHVTRNPSAHHSDERHTIAETASWIICVICD